MKKTPAAYRPVQIALHWGIALLLLGLFVFEDEMGRALRNVLNGGNATYTPGLAFHVFGGLTVLALVVWRLVLRKTSGVPAAPENDPPLQKLAAHAVHLALYAVMVLVPVAGAAAWFGGVRAAGDAHEVLGGVLQFLVAVHVLAALWHQFVVKDDLIRRMFPRR